MLVNLNTFKGQNFAIPNHMLPLELGQVAKNMYIEDGRFVPMYATSFDPVSSHFTGNEQTLYQHRDINNNTKKWFTKRTELLWVRKMKMMKKTTTNSL